MTQRKMLKPLKPKKAKKDLFQRLKQSIDNGSSRFKDFVSGPFKEKQTQSGKYDAIFKQLKNLQETKEAAKRELETLRRDVQNANKLIIPIQKPTLRLSDVRKNKLHAETPNEVKIRKEIEAEVKAKAEMEAEAEEPEAALKTNPEECSRPEKKPTVVISDSQETHLSSLDDDDSLCNDGMNDNTHQIVHQCSTSSANIGDWSWAVSSQTQLSSLDHQSVGDATSSTKDVPSPTLDATLEEQASNVGARPLFESVAPVVGPIQDLSLQERINSFFENNVEEGNDSQSDKSESIDLLQNHSEDTELPDLDGTDAAHNEPEVNLDEWNNQESDHHTEVNQGTTQAQVHADPDPSFYQKGDDIRLNLGLRSHTYQEDTTTEYVNDQEQDGGPEIVNEQNNSNVALDPELSDVGGIEAAQEGPQLGDLAEGRTQESDHQTEVQDNPTVRGQPKKKSKNTAVECHFCKRKFKNRFSLEKHLKHQHTKDGKLRTKKVKCPLCKIFKSKTNIQRHKKTCAKNMERRRLQTIDRHCVLCDKTFKNKRSKDSHFAKFHDNETTKCSDCGEEVTYSYMSQHQERDCNNRPDNDDEEEETDENESED